MARTQQLQVQIPQGDGEVPENAGFVENFMAKFNYGAHCRIGSPDCGPNENWLADGLRNGMTNDEFNANLFYSAVKGWHRQYNGLYQALGNSLTEMSTWVPNTIALVLPPTEADPKGISVIDVLNVANLILTIVPEVGILEWAASGVIREADTVVAQLTKDSEIAVKDLTAVTRQARWDLADKTKYGASYWEGLENIATEHDNVFANIQKQLSSNIQSVTDTAKNVFTENKKVFESIAKKAKLGTDVIAKAIAKVESLGRSTSVDTGDDLSNNVGSDGSSKGGDSGAYLDWIRTIVDQMQDSIGTVHDAVLLREPTFDQSLFDMLASGEFAANDPDESHFKASYSRFFKNLTLNANWRSNLVYVAKQSFPDEATCNSKLKNWPGEVCLQGTSAPDNTWIDTSRDSPSYWYRFLPSQVSMQQKFFKTTGSVGGSDAPGDTGSDGWPMRHAQVAGLDNVKAGRIHIDDKWPALSLGDVYWNSYRCQVDSDPHFTYGSLFPQPDFAAADAIAAESDTQFKCHFTLPVMDVNSEDYLVNCNAFWKSVFATKDEAFPKVGSDCHGAFEQNYYMQRYLPYTLALKAGLASLGDFYDQYHNDYFPEDNWYDHFDGSDGW